MNNNASATSNLLSPTLKDIFSPATSSALLAGTHLKTASSASPSLIPLLSVSLLSSSTPICLGSSITSFDLSFNSFTVPVPPTIPKFLNFIVHLNFTSNSLTGNIPPSLSNCTFLNLLNLAFNHHSGSIPPLLSSLIRLASLDLSNNSLSGLFPVSLAKFGSLWFHNNPLLWGYPFSSSCVKPPAQTSLSSTIVVNLASGVFGFLLSLSISYVFSSFGFFLKSLTLKKETNWASSTDKGMTGSRQWSDQLGSSSHSRLIPVSLFQNLMVELKVADLMATTKDFHPDNIVVVGSSNLGTSQKAVLSDGSAPVVKRLQECLLPEHQFRVAMGWVRQILHPNLALLLSFCIARRDF